MIIDCIADLHGHYPELEGGDLLIIAGDLTATGAINEYLDFNKWLSRQQYERKIVIAGNHDKLCEKGILINTGKTVMMPTIPVLDNKTIYICDSGTEFEGLKIWGTPWTKTFLGMNPRCKAFTCDTEEELAEKYQMIPEDTDILISHGP